MSRRDVIVTTAAVALAALTYVMISTPGGARSVRDFEPARLADLEVDMWQAYYGGERLRLFRGLAVIAPGAVSLFVEPLHQSRRVICPRRQHVCQPSRRVRAFPNSSAGTASSVIA